MDRQYVEKQNQGYRIVGTRVSLDSVVFAFLKQTDNEFEALRKITSEPAFVQKMAKARREMRTAYL